MANTVVKLARVVDVLAGFVGGMLMVQIFLVTQGAHWGFLALNATMFVLALGCCWNNRRVLRWTGDSVWGKRPTVD